jgi:diguanylate cyclase (GGDEF)-like protein/hemerythrin-like metal-binding protein
VDTTNLPALHSLIQRLPFPLVLFDNKSGACFANDSFANLFGRGSVDSPDLRRLAHSPGGAWQPVKLRQRDGRDVEAHAQAVALGDDGVLLVFDKAAGPILMDETERLQERISELENLSATDRLTGVWNRAHLERMVDVEISRTDRAGHPATLILVDIDHFKRINDDHEHLTGDAVLKEFVGRIGERMRGTDTLFRWGGDEFVVLAAAVGYRGGAVVAEDLRRTIAAVPFAKVGAVTASLGVAEYMEGEGAKSWFQRTDRALYAAKSAGRNRVYVDRRGNSDLNANRSATGLVRLQWREAYECGDPAIDAEHRELFDRGNALIAAALEQNSEPMLWRTALDSTLVHLAEHFRNEEALLGQTGYARLAEHQSGHARLLERAGELKAAVDGGKATLGNLVTFLVRDVIAQHILKTDRDFYLQFRSENGGGADRGRS